MGSKKSKKNKKELFTIWYHAVLIDTNEVWGESSDLRELMRLCKGKKVKIYEMKKYLVTLPWKEMQKSKVKKIVQRQKLEMNAWYGRT